MELSQNAPVRIPAVSGRVSASVATGPSVHAAAAEPNGPDRGLLGLLTAGIPLTLLIDLAPPQGPDSRAIYADERGQQLLWATA